eukprot:12717335-Alexandrium_andersonii.AAC.1
MSHPSVPEHPSWSSRPRCSHSSESRVFSLLEARGSGQEELWLGRVHGALRAEPASARTSFGTS